MKAKVWLFLFLVLLSRTASATEIKIVLGGPKLSYQYTSMLLTRALKAEGYDANISYIGALPTPRLEIMLGNGDISCFILGQTDERSEKFLTIDIGMTNNLFGHRILFIREGTQLQYDDIHTLEDLRATGKIAGMGSAWGDVQIWKDNQLPVQTIEGDWKNLYKMVFSGNRNVDYLSRGAQEMIQDAENHPELAIEKNLVLVYKKDHILYVSPKQPELFELLLKVMKKAEETGLIAQVAKEFYADVYEAPINLGDRRVIQLSSPSQ